MSLQLTEIYENSALESRAWCLQERLLSVRMIQFSGSELLWECQTNTQRESSIAVDAGKTWGDQSETSLFLVNRVLPSLDQDLFAHGGALDVWYNLVKQYSSRN
jgi:hypothetical protein